MSLIMKSMIYVPLFFLSMLLALVIYDAVNAFNLRKDLLLKEDRIHFSYLIVKSAHAHYPLIIDSFHYVVFTQHHDHDERLKMLEEMDSVILLYVEKGIKRN